MASVQTERRPQTPTSRSPRLWPGDQLFVQYLVHDQDLDRQTALSVVPAESGVPLVPGEVLVPPAGRHLLVSSDARVHLIATGQIPPARPSADLLLSTLAVALGSRAVAVVLTGSGHDASLGVQAITLFGGACFMQDEASWCSTGCPTLPLRPATTDLRCRSTRSHPCS